MDTMNTVLVLISAQYIDYYVIHKEKPQKYVHAYPNIVSGKSEPLIKNCMDCSLLW